MMDLPQIHMVQSWEEEPPSSLQYTLELFVGNTLN